MVNLVLYYPGCDTDFLINCSVFNCHSSFNCNNYKEERYIVKKQYVGWLVGRIYGSLIYEEEIIKSN